MTERCSWCGSDPLYMDYHDTEWGVPVRDDATLFEFLLLEGAQAGLAWITILRKREGYRRLFSDFDANKVARYSDSKLEKLLQDPAIIRNKLKVYGAPATPAPSWRCRKSSAVSRITSGISWMASRFRTTGAA